MVFTLIITHCDPFILKIFQTLTLFVLTHKKMKYNSTRTSTYHKPSTFIALKAKFKSVSTREIRQRGFQRKNSVKYGTKAEETIIFGDYISIPGNIYHKTKFDPYPCNFVYFVQDYIFAGDNVFRKSCRPNTQVEIRMVNKKATLVAMAIRDIHINDEIVLPLDYENKGEGLVCICNDVDFCLKM